MIHSYRNQEDVRPREMMLLEERLKMILVRRKEQAQEPQGTKKPNQELSCR